MVRLAYEDYYTHLGLTPEAVGLGQPAIVSRVALYAVVPFVLVAAWLGFAVVAYRITMGFHARSMEAVGWSDQAAAAMSLLGVAVVLLIVPVLSLRLLARGPGARLVVGLLPSAIGNAVLIAGIVTAAFASEDLRWRMRRFWRAHFGPAAPLFLVLLVVALVTSLAINFWVGADHAGQTVRARGELPRNRFGYLSVTVSPARVIPKGADGLGVCDGRRRTVLVGRHDGTSYVLFLPTEGSSLLAEVVPLLESEYAVATATGEAQTCNPKAP